MLSHFHLSVFLVAAYGGHFLSFTASRSNTDVSSASQNPDQMSSAFLKASNSQTFSPINVTIPLPSLLSCVIRGKTDQNSVVVNFSEEDKICQLLYLDGGEESFSVRSESSWNWKSVVLKQLTGEGVIDTVAGVSVDNLQDPLTTTSSPVGCLQNKLGQFENKCYKLVTDEMAMFEAVTWCQTDGGQMVSIESEDEQIALCSFLKDRSLEIWTGGTFDKGVPYWSSSGQDIGYTNWQDNGAPLETSSTAVYLDTSGTGCPWRTEAFTTRKVFICEYGM